MKKQNDVPKGNDKQKLDISFLERDNILKMPWEAQKALLARVLNYQLQSYSSESYGEDKTFGLDFRPSLQYMGTVPYIHSLKRALNLVIKAKPGTHFLEGPNSVEIFSAIGRLKNLISSTHGNDTEFSKETLEFARALKKEIETAPIYKESRGKRNELDSPK